MTIQKTINEYIYHNSPLIILMALFILCVHIIYQYNEQNNKKKKVEDKKKLIKTESFLFNQTKKNNTFYTAPFSLINDSSTIYHSI